MESHRPTILIADDHTLVAEVCSKLLQPEFDVVGVVQDGHAMLRAAAERKPDVAIIDLAMPGINGLDACKRLKQTNRTMKLIILTMNVQPDVAAEAYRVGASGYVVKSGSAEELIVAVRRALRNEPFLSSEVSKEAVDFLRHSHPDLTQRKALTARQRKIMRLLAEGKTPDQIGKSLQITRHTVFFHKYQIMKRLAIRSSAELIRYAIQLHQQSSDRLSVAREHDKDFSVPSESSAKIVGRASSHVLVRLQ